MFALFARSHVARGAVVVASCLAVLGLAHAAVAGDDLGFRRAEFWPERLFAPVAAPAAPAAADGATRHRGPRRIWAAARSRPLRIGLERGGRRTRLAAQRRALREAGAGRGARSTRLVLLPRPDRPALVSIYQDRTLRNGDAVMMADGIHLFHGGARWPHRGSDFIRLQFVASLGWSLRRTLSGIDSAPPDRWSRDGTAAG